MNLKIKLSLFIIGITALLFYIFVYSEYQGREAMKKSKFFFNQGIQGRIGYCYSDKQGTIFKIQGNSQRYWFLPVRKSNGRYLSFCRDAQEGDFVIKHPKDSLLFLLKSNGDTLTYSFHVAQ